MTHIKKYWLKYYFILISLAVVGLFGFSNDTFALGSDRPFGGKISIMGPALAIKMDKTICQAMEFTVVEVTVTTTWEGETDKGSDKTFTLMPNYSPSPHPSTFRLENSVRSKSSYDAQRNRWVLGLYQNEYKKIGTCKVKTTITYPPSSSTTDIPYYLNMGKITMYGASQGS